jgi:hypothetical protein
VAVVAVGATAKDKVARVLAPARRLARIRWLRRLVVLSLWALILYLASGLVRQSLHRLDSGYVHLTVAAVVAWGGLLLVARGTDVVGWHVLVRSMGAEAGLTETARVYTTSELVRYLPGGVLHFAARYKFAGRLGVSPRAVVATTAVDLALRLATGLALFAVSLPFWPHVPAAYVVLTVLALPALLAASHPRVLARAIGLAERVLGKVHDPIEVPYRAVATATAWYVLGWLVRGVVTVMVARTMLDLPASAFLPVVGATGLSWAVGVLVPLAPGGLGAREAAGTALLRQYLPASAGLAVMLLVRLATMATEFLAAGIAVLLARRPARSVAPAPGPVGTDRTAAIHQLEETAA